VSDADRSPPSMPDEIEKLNRMAARLRLTGLLCLAASAFNALIVVFLFLMYALNYRIFKNPESYSTRDVESIIAFFLVVASMNFVIALSLLYYFEQLRRAVTITVSEIFDDMGWYSGKHEGPPPPHIGLSERISLKIASENTTLPFLTSSQGAIFYVFFNLLTYAIVCFVSINLLQALR
jgi:hypothetical protein